MNLRRREHARSVTVSVCGNTVRHERGEFVGGRDDVADGSYLFGGVADFPAPEPVWPVDRDELADRLRTFASWLDGDVSLQHRVVATGRSVVAGAGSVNERLGVVFAITGTASALPVGFSGAGTGLDVLADRELAETLGRTRRVLAAGHAPVCGQFPAVLSPQAAAVIVHEAVGHYAEAMHVGAPAVHRLFTRIASDCLSVMDESAGEHDDEGVVSLGATEVVRGGVLVAQLHNRATARAAATAPTGNARAAQVWDPPLPRMSSLVCAPGTQPEAALVAEMSRGVYIHRVADGYRQGTRVSARVVLGERVVRGRRTGRYFTGSRIAGRLDLLTRLVELGDRVERNQNAMCGKDGQLLFDVATAAPAMRLSALCLAS